jgi:glucose-6-phosphate 1-dehydrogenase
MSNQRKLDPTIIVIFGAGGDLTWRYLVPALYSLNLDGWLPEHFHVIGLDIKDMSDQQFRDRLRKGMGKFFDRGKVESSSWEKFASNFAFLKADFSDPSAYSNLSKQLTDREEQWGLKANRIFYQATPPEIVKLIIDHIGQAGLSKDRERVRIVLEKPFGHDLGSARSLNQMILKVFEESQIYRIDHYLGKETVQNILAFRFANALFEPIWDRRYIDHVQITVGEQVGVEHRGEYYEHAGALRDMVQNHLMQVLCLIAMEPPLSFDADEIRNKKLDVLRAIRPIPREEVRQWAARGQYAAGWIDGQHVPAYRDEPGVAPDSDTETFAAVKLLVDNWRWQGVPFYLRTGKRMNTRASQAFIRFRPVPHQSFPPAVAEDWEPNGLAILIQPDEGILLQFQAKQPGLRVRLSPVEMRFCYQDAFNVSSPEAYETLILDVALGDATLFMRADQIEAAWAVVDPIVEAWSANPPAKFPNYESGSWGPEESEALIAADGRSWMLPDAIGDCRSPK